jgi:general stress protein YciG
MAGTKAGGATLRQTMIEKYGSEEAWKEFMRHNGRLGGQNGTTGGFYANRELARQAGAKGGRISRRGKGREA